MTILIRALDRNLAKSASAAPVGEQRVNSGRATATLVDKQRVNSGRATATRVDKVLDCLSGSLFPCLRLLWRLARGILCSFCQKGEGLSSDFQVWTKISHESY